MPISLPANVPSKPATRASSSALRLNAAGATQAAPLPSNAISPSMPAAYSLSVVPSEPSVSNFVSAIWVPMYRQVVPENFASPTPASSSAGIRPVKVSSTGSTPVRQFTASVSVRRFAVSSSAAVSAICGPSVAPTPRLNASCGAKTRSPSADLSHSAVPGICVLKPETPSPPPASRPPTAWRRPLTDQRPAAIGSSYVAPPLQKFRPSESFS